MPSKKTIVAWLATIIIAAACSSVSGQGIEFKFNPPDSITFYQNLKQTKVNETGNIKNVDVTESRIKVHLSKTETGYDYVMTPESVVATRNGQPMVHPIFDLMTKLRPVYHIDSAGQIVSIDGYDKAVDLIRETMPPEIAPQLSSMFNEQTLIAGDITEWNGRIGDFVGAVVEVGDVFYSEETIPLPIGGSATYYTVVKILEKTACAENECVRIAFSYNSDPDGLKEFMGDFFEEFVAAVDSSAGDVAISDIKITGEGERVIDPATMLIISESNSRTIQMQLEVPGEGLVNSTVQEERVYNFEY